MVNSRLDQIKSANDIRKIPPSDYGLLAEEIRSCLVDVISHTGGHLASNLGIVEVTMALHLCMTFPEDKLIFDVGHQSYVHKILTGRRREFRKIRTFGGISGFPKRSESGSDAFGTGHSSTALSAALGFAAARERLGQDYKIAAVVGDGAATGGMFYEAFNHLTYLKGNLVLVFNDNGMSISPNVGALAEWLNSSGRKHSPAAFFDGINMEYRGPLDGHDLGVLVPAVKDAFGCGRPVLLHVLTEKGKGYEPAEKNPVWYHGLAGTAREESYTNVFGKTMTDIARKDDRVTAVCAAMEHGTGLCGFREAYPQRFYDVGIAEAHAVTFAAGLAAGGLRPYVAVYSSFLQRAFDQIIHDVCLQRLPVVFCLDRAGIVGEDGETHQGIFDLSYLTLMPGMTVAAPGDQDELREFLFWSLEFSAPLAIRYPKRRAYPCPVTQRDAIRLGKSEVLMPGRDIALLAVGSMVEDAVRLHDILAQKGYWVSVVNVRFIKPFDRELLFRLTCGHRLFVTMEENVWNGGYGQQVSAYLAGSGSNVHVLNIGIGDMFVKHGTIDGIKRELGLDKDTLAERIIKEYRCCEK